MAMVLFFSRRNYVFIQGVVITFLFMLAYLLDMKGSKELFYFLCGWNILTYGGVLYNELTKSPNFHPFIIFALISLQYCGFSSISIIQMLNSGESIFLGTTKINNALTLGYLYLTLEHYLIFCGYFLYDNYKMKKNGDNESIIYFIYRPTYDLYKIGFYNYLVVIFLRIINYAIFPLASISSVLNTYSTTGYLVSLAILSYAMLIESRKSIKILYWLITCIEIIFVLGEGMKQAIITPLLPYIIYLLIAYKSGKLKLTSVSFIFKVAIITVFIVGFVFPYISAFRNIASREKKEWSDISVSQALSEYIANAFGNISNKNTQSGLEYFLNRAGSIGSNSFSIDYAEKNGYSPQYFFTTTSVLIPRILWPSKPNSIRGSMAYLLSLGYSYEDAFQKANSTRNITSITLGFVGSSYLVFGFWGAFIFPLIAGLFSAYVWHFVRIRQNDIIAIWLFYSLMTTIFIDYENFVDFGLVFYAWSIVYMVVIKLNEKYRVYG